MSYIVDNPHTSVSGTGSCSYASLGSYNAGYGAGPMAPVPVSARFPSATTKENYGQYVVPTFGGLPSYDALTLGKSGCGGYAAVTKAYPYAESKQCYKYTTRLCGGNVNTALRRV
jgi:hypothetical protein